MKIYGDNLVQTIENPRSQIYHHINSLAETQLDREKMYISICNIPGMNLGNNLFSFFNNNKIAKHNISYKFQSLQIIKSCKNVDILK